MEKWIEALPYLLACINSVDSVQQLSIFYGHNYPVIIMGFSNDIISTFMVSQIIQ